MNKNQQLREKLKQAEETLEAIQTGKVDAVIVHDEAGKRQVYSQKNTFIQEQGQWLEKVLDLMPTPILMIAPQDGTVLFVNKAMKQLSGNEIRVGSQWNSDGKILCYDALGIPIPAQDLPSIRAAKGEKITNLQIDCMMPQGRKSLLVNAEMVPSMPGRQQTIILTLQDITVIRETEKRKDDFISMASHELKTPITSMKLFLQTIKKQFVKEGKESMMPVLDKMDNQIDKLTRLVRELLDVSRIYAGKLQITKEAFDLNGLIEDLADNFQQTTLIHEIVVKSDLDTIILGDKDRISQVVINLLTNAIKYSPAGGKIVISVKSNDEYVIVSVKDRGIGIDKEHIMKIFERFYQVTSPKEKTYPGLGMGLYISYEIIKHHGGKMWVTSEKGKGSTFYFSINKAR